MEKLTYLDRFLFTYNGMTNINSNLGYTFNKFVIGQTIIMQFQVHSLNFQTAKKPDAKLEYTF